MAQLSLQEENWLCPGLTGVNAFMILMILTKWLSRSYDATWFRVVGLVFRLQIGWEGGAS